MPDPGGSHAPPALAEGPIDFENLREHPEVELARVARIDIRDLDVALQRHTSLYAYCGARREVAKARVARAAWEVEKAEARAFARARDNGDAIGVAKEMTCLDEEVQAAKDRHLREEAEADMLYRLVRAMEHRKSMLEQLANDRRQEMRNQGG